MDGATFGANIHYSNMTHENVYREIFMPFLCSMCDFNVGLCGDLLFQCSECDCDIKWWMVSSISSINHYVNMAHDKSYWKIIIIIIMIHLYDRGYNGNLWMELPFGTNAHYLNMIYNSYREILMLFHCAMGDYIVKMCKDLLQCSKGEGNIKWWMDLSVRPISHYVNTTQDKSYWGIFLPFKCFDCDVKLSIDLMSAPIHTSIYRPLFHM